jgi:anti-sigma regulatory factor (Ser/Thr protein kinase)
MPNSLLTVVRPRDPVLTVANFDRFLTEVAAASDAQESSIVFDLRSVEFIDLFAMLGVAYLCADLCDAESYRVRLELGDDGACSFLPRAGFFDILPGTDAIEFDFPAARIEYLRLYHGANTGLLELTPFASSDAIDAVLGKFIGILRHRLRYPKDDAYDLAIMLSELCHNVINHHEDPAAAAGVAAMQVHDGRAGRFVQVVVGDRGVGIRRTLARNPAHADLPSDAAAILRSVELGVSEHAEETRGNGLYHLRRLVIRHGGSLHIRSGCGKAYYPVDQSHPRTFAVPWLSGTQYAIALPVKAG